MNKKSDFSFEEETEKKYQKKDKKLKSVMRVHGAKVKQLSKIIKTKKKK